MWLIILSPLLLFVVDIQAKQEMLQKNKGRAGSGLYKDVKKQSRKRSADTLHQPSVLSTVTVDNLEEMEELRKQPRGMPSHMGPKVRQRQRNNPKQKANVRKQQRGAQAERKSQGGQLERKSAQGVRPEGQPVSQQVRTVTRLSSVIWMIC